ncbi:MAG: tRNA epoxyqueuosine(34) reductase QueG [Bacteroidetes bacterium]|nr:MAG: tRNA epoxyqueuosine(34) reductase QueG [Bacteroidota bacterium]
MDRQEISRRIKQEGQRLGFDLVGISRAEFLETEAKHLEQWLSEGRQGKMDYMERHFDKRLDPRLLVEGAKSVISVIHNYFPDATTQPPGAPKISRYAWGEDYHKVLKTKLYELFTFICAETGSPLNGRVFVDSAPVMDKAWARKSGLGWIGKHTNLISPKKGSYFFIGEIILDLELEYDGPVRDYCGTCTRCIDACPTEALSPYQIDASKCISYLSIELKEETPADFHGALEGWAYGCDICQEVCPWNRFSQAHSEEAFKPLTLNGLPIPSLSAQDWEEVNEQTFKRLARKSAMGRVRWQKFTSNLRLAFRSSLRETLPPDSPTD